MLLEMLMGRCKNIHTSCRKEGYVSTRPKREQRLEARGEINVSFDVANVFLSMGLVFVRFGEEDRRKRQSCVSPTKERGTQTHASARGDSTPSQPLYPSGCTAEHLPAPEYTVAHRVRSWGLPTGGCWHSVHTAIVHYAVQSSTARTYMYLPMLCTYLVDSRTRSIESPGFQSRSRSSSTDGRHTAPASSPLAARVCVSSPIAKRWYMHANDPHPTSPPCILNPVRPSLTDLRTYVILLLLSARRRYWVRSGRRTRNA